ncbi:sedoheptulokinase-like isoform X1 [Penaeus japonicus]|uniref:sedoheptulokinase-like isoform X1 n=2 Tax=Penaeus japonicus TaxID=27405 RepID=UPI001C7126FA|nr:sedoheptulokinase-like isoform X1 [Penaeus japonicus]
MVSLRGDRYHRLLENGRRMGTTECVLGIDIGTTSVKCCLVDVNSREVISSQKKDTYSDVPSELGTEGSKQDVPRILSALQMCVSRLPREATRKVTRIGVCGQMHGCMLWKHGQAWEQKPDSDRFEIREVSNSYTWQDNRCTQEFLSSLPVPESHLSIASGYGCATLLWFSKNKPEKLTRFNRAGTIHDFLVCMLCGLDRPVMSVQNAASWGFFNTVTKKWNEELLQEAGLTSDLLPTVVDSGQEAGQLENSWYGIPAKTPVIASLGDLQCSVLPLLSGNDVAVVNISTSAQICFRMSENCETVRKMSPSPKPEKDFVPPEHPPNSPQPLEYFPFFDNTYLAVAASLNGGNVLAAFVRTVQQWSLELGFQVPQSKIWQRILALGAEPQSQSSLVVEPTIFGERHSPQENAMVSNIDLGNISLGKVTRGLCKGIITNIHSMMPRSLLIENGITKIIGGGSALTRNPILHNELEEAYQLPVTLDSRGDAAYGSALAAINSKAP